MFFGFALTSGCEVPSLDPESTDPDHEAEITTRPIVLSAAFTPLSHATIYDIKGNEIFSADGEGSVAVALSPGDYYLDLRDDKNNPLFDSEGKMWFAPKVDVGEIELAPHYFPGIDIQLAMLSIPETGKTQQAIHTFGSAWDARNRVVWEAARAMAGPGLATGYVWSTSTTYAGYNNYLGEDTGAWSSVLSSGSYSGIASCWYWGGSGCHVSASYDPSNPSQYTCQNTTCPSASGKYRGGQCKPFTNLILYRSGVYHVAGTWNFKSLPSDSAIPSVASLLTTSSMQLGDVLRRTTSGSPHATIIVRILSTTQAVVFDSNWLGGDGYEYIGSHVLNILTSGGSNGGLSDLDTYYDLDCVYNTGVPQC